MGKEVRDYGLVLAVDATDRDEVLSLVAKVGPYIDGVKVGVPTLLANGVSLLRSLGSLFPGPLIADLKVADIGFRDRGRPWSGTNRSIVETVVSAGVDYVICHSIVGSSSIQECVDTAHGMGGRVLTLPYMTPQGAGLFFDMPIDEHYAKKSLESLDMGPLAKALVELERRKSSESGWRVPRATVSDLVLLMGETVGVDGYIAPANRPEVMVDCRRLTQRKIMATGVGRQGGKLGDVYTVLGKNSAAILGHAIYDSGDPVAACRTLHDERDGVTGGR